MTVNSQDEWNGIVYRYRLEIFDDPLVFRKLVVEQSSLKGGGGRGDKKEKRR